MYSSKINGLKMINYKLINCFVLKIELFFFRKTLNLFHIAIRCVIQVFRNEHSIKVNILRYVFVLSFAYLWVFLTLPIFFPYDTLNYLRTGPRTMMPGHFCQPYIYGGSAFKSVVSMKI